MIIDRHIEILVVGKTVQYWKDKGYDAISNSSMIVDIKDLPVNSNYKVMCICESCNKQYEQRFSRNKEVCGECRASHRMSGNNIGQFRKKIQSPSKNDLISLIEIGYGKHQISKKYKVSIPVVNRWLKESDIDLKPYYGRLFFKTPEDKRDAIDKISDVSITANISEASRATDIPRHMIRHLKKSGDVNIETTLEKFTRSYQNILDNLDDYIKDNDTKDLKTIAEDNNISLQCLKKAFFERGVNVKLHSYNKSKGEMDCRAFIESLEQDCHSIMIDKTYEIDCYVPDKQFGVEYCGEFWHRFTKEKSNKYYHRDKMRFAKSKGIGILTIFENEWYSKRDIVESILRSKLGCTGRIYARKCILKEVDRNTARNFHEDNHISGYTNSSINIGLFHDGILVSVLSFVKSRFDKNYEYEISRFSSILDHTVVGGLSKMFSYFVKTYNPKSCMTYSDLRFGEGKSYEKIGFSLLCETVPNYFYYHKSKKHFESRMKYQKHKLKNMKSYSIDKTEYQIMSEEGFYTIYDCGNKKYGWQNNTIHI